MLSVLKGNEGERRGDEMTREDAIIMLESLKEYIAVTPIAQYCTGCSQTRIPGEECEQCISASLRALDLAIEKVQEVKE